MIDRANLPATGGEGEFGDGEIVDALGEGLGGGDIKRAFDLAQDHAEMGDDDQRTAGMGRNQPVNGGIGAGAGAAIGCGCIGAG